MGKSKIRVNFEKKNERKLTKIKRKHYESLGKVGEKSETIKINLRIGAKLIVHYESAWESRPNQHAASVIFDVWRGFRDKTRGFDETFDDNTSSFLSCHFHLWLFFSILLSTRLSSGKYRRKSWEKKMRNSHRFAQLLQIKGGVPKLHFFAEMCLW